MLLKMGFVNRTLWVTKEDNSWEKSVDLRRSSGRFFKTLTQFFADEDEGRSMARRPAKEGIFAGRFGSPRLRSLATRASRVSGRFVLPRALFVPVFGVQSLIQLQHIHARFAQESQIAGFGPLRDQIPNLLRPRAASLRHAFYLRVG